MLQSPANHHRKAPVSQEDCPRWLADGMGGWLTVSWIPGLIHIFKPSRKPKKPKKLRHLAHNRAKTLKKQKKSKKP